VLLISEPRANQSEICEDVKAIAKCSDLRLAIKVRPGEKKPYIHAYLQENDLLYEIVSTGTVYEAISDCDVVLGSYGTILYEAILFQKPTVLLNTHFQYGNELAEEGLTAFSDSPQSIVEIIRKAYSTGDKELSRRRDIVWGPKYDSEKGAVNIVNLGMARL
jgi:UDP-N-acetylglucosamine 2-epimerase